MNKQRIAYTKWKTKLGRSGTQPTVCCVMESCMYVCKTVNLFQAIQERKMHTSALGEM